MNEQSKPCCVSEDCSPSGERDFSVERELIEGLEKLTEEGELRWKDPSENPPRCYLSSLPALGRSFLLTEGSLRIFAGKDPSKDYTLCGPRVTELYRRVAEISQESRIATTLRQGIVGGLIYYLENPGEPASADRAPSPKLFQVSLETNRRKTELLVQAENGMKAVQRARAWSCCEAIEEEEVVRTGLPLALDTSSEGVKYVSHTANRIFSLAYEGRGETMLFLVAARNEAEAEKLAEKAMEDKPMLCGTLKVRDIQEFSISESAVLLAHYCIKD